MKIVVTGSLGHIGKPLTEELVRKEHQITVISSKAERQKDIEDLGASIAVGSLEDVDFLTSTLNGADALFAMIPPNYHNETDIIEYYRRLGENYAQAIQKSGIGRVVHLSSWGADLDKETGFILGSHVVEGIFNKLPDVAVTHLRAGSMYYNFYGFIEMIKSAGLISANYGGEDKIVMVAPNDVAAAAAEELTKSSAGKNVRYVVSDDRTASEVARVLGAAVGKPDLQWQTITDEQMRSGLEQAGLPENIIAGSIELGSATHSGVMRRGYEQHQPSAMGKVKLEDFAKEFAAAF